MGKKGGYQVWTGQKLYCMNGGTQEGKYLKT